MHSGTTSLDWCTIIIVNFNISSSFHWMRQYTMSQCQLHISVSVLVSVLVSSIR